MGIPLHKPYPYSLYDGEDEASIWGTNEMLGEQTAVLAIPLNFRSSWNFFVHDRGLRLQSVLIGKNTLSEWLEPGQIWTPFNQICATLGMDKTWTIYCHQQYVFEFFFGKERHPLDSLLFFLTVVIKSQCFFFSWLVYFTHRNLMKSLGFVWGFITARLITKVNGALNTSERHSYVNRCELRRHSRDIH